MKIALACLQLSVLFRPDFLSPKHDDSSTGSLKKNDRSPNLSRVYEAQKTLQLAARQRLAAENEFS